MANFPFPKGHLEESQVLKDETVKLECTSFFAENLGEVDVTILGRTLAPGDNFTVPFNGVALQQDLRVKFATTAGRKELYLLQTVSQECEN